MKICVLGGSGFVGSHLCDQLTIAGHEVRIFDLVDSTWRMPSQQMILGDLLDPEALFDAVRGCDVVYNFAGLADLDESWDKPLLVADLNIMGNIRALEACRQQGVGRYIFASTVYVYSREGGFYRCSKVAAEQFIAQYQKTFGLDFAILRFGSLYGTRSDRRNGLFRIVEQALLNKYVGYEGSVNAMREYIHVEDAALASISAMGEEFKNQHVVLTGQEPMKVEDMLKMLSEILDISSEIKFTEPQHLGHYTRTPYAHQSTIGRKFTPPLHVDLGQGLLELIEYVMANINLSDKSDRISLTN